MSITTNISAYISNIDYKKHINNISNQFSNPKIKTLITLVLINLHPSDIGNSNSIYRKDDIGSYYKSLGEDKKAEERLSVEHSYDTISNFSHLDIDGVPPEEFFTDGVLSIEGNPNVFFKTYCYKDILNEVGTVIPNKYIHFLGRHPNKIRADLLMGYIDRSYKDNFDKMQDIYDTLHIDKSYRYPIFQKLNIIFDQFAQKHLNTQDINLYNSDFYSLLYAKILQDNDFYTYINRYIGKYAQIYNRLKNRASTNEQFEFDDNSEVKNYNIKFSDRYYKLPPRLNYRQVEEEFDKIGVEIYSSAEFDNSAGNKFAYYTTATHGFSSLIPIFLNQLQQDLKEMFPEIDIGGGEDNLVIRGGTEYSHSDYFTSVHKKTIQSNKIGFKPKVVISKQRNYLFDYDKGRLADVKNNYKVDDNTIKGDYIDKIITKHQFGYSIDMQSRGKLGIALSIYSGVRSTAYSFRNKNKISVKQYGLDNEITALFSYHDNHFHILVIPSDLYSRIKDRL